MSLGFGFSPSINYRTLGIKKEFRDTFPYDLLKESEDSLNQSKITLNYSFDFLFDLAPKFAIETGVHFRQKGFVYELEEVNNFDFEDFQYSFLVSTVAIPVNMRFYLSKGIRPLFFSAGLSAGIVTSSKYITRVKHNDYTQRQITQIYDNTFSNFDLSMRLGFGYRTYIGESGIMTIEPYFLKSFNNVEESDAFNFKLYSFGLRMGFQVEL